MRGQEQDIPLFSYLLRKALHFSLPAGLFMASSSILATDFGSVDSANSGNEAWKSSYISSSSLVGEDGQWSCVDCSTRMRTYLVNLSVEGLIFSRRFQ